MTVLPKRVIHLSSCKYLTKQGVRISLLSFQPKDISLGQNGLGGYDINVKARQARINVEVWVQGFQFYLVFNSLVIYSTFLGLLLF